MLRYCLRFVPCAMILACNDPERPVVPVDQSTTTTVYELGLAELKKQLIKDTMVSPVRWADKMYLNPRVLLPAADSANPLYHDHAWVASVVERGLVRGACGQPPYEVCPVDSPIAYTSLGVPWTRGGDTVFVGGGYTGVVPNQKAADAIFWLFTVVKGDSGWQVKSKGPPNTMTFTDSTTS